MPVMERIAIRELRNQASRVVRRAHAGERLIIASLEELIATGDVVAPRLRTPPSPPKPVPAPSGGASADILAELRER
jgi:antitoxin (DNA-binding transcriptional repressor) of toxin-antitoxin stability system